MRSVKGAVAGFVKLDSAMGAAGTAGTAGDDDCAGDTTAAEVEEAVPAPVMPAESTTLALPVLGEAKLATSVRGVNGDDDTVCVVFRIAWILWSSALVAGTGAGNGGGGGDTTGNATSAASGDKDALTPGDVSASDDAVGACVRELPAVGAAGGDAGEGAG
jgi:hypothetical protein